MDFADTKVNFNYLKCREVLIVGAKLVDVFETAPKPWFETLLQPVKTADIFSSKAAPKPEQFSTTNPRQSSIQFFDFINGHIHRRRVQLRYHILSTQTPSEVSSFTALSPMTAYASDAEQLSLVLPPKKKQKKKHSEN